MPYSGEPLLVKELARRAKRYKELLKPAPAADTIPAARGTGLRTSGATAGGNIDSPITEQAYEGSVYYQLVSSDGLFVYEFPDETLYIDNSGQQLNVKHLEP